MLSKVPDHVTVWCRAVLYDSRGGVDIAPEALQFKVGRLLL